RQTENLAAVQAFLMGVDLYFIDEETAIFYSQLKAAVFHQFAPKDKNKRRSTSMRDLGFDDHDLWIAATAIQHSLVLVSADSDFIRIQQAQPFLVEYWL
ncbi:MAG: type II toxin-antitoxin system VapC family toxin, partial [Scytonema sp. RU_4_4]|nr:type II toxin-antitoxin system VapC family toxin [Scytonema sp. RU_4_4]